MMGAFLDALGITHENGLIQEDAIAPDPAKMAAAAIARDYPARCRAPSQHAPVAGSGVVGAAAWPA